MNIELPQPDDEHPEVFARWFLPDHTQVGCDVPGARRDDKTVWLTPFARCTPAHAHAVAVALLAAAQRAELTPLLTEAAGPVRCRDCGTWIERSEPCVDLRDQTGDVLCQTCADEAGMAL